MADIKCSICGQMNPAGLTVCQNCGASLSTGGESIQPGEQPTRKTTSELEQVLPPWLREARIQGRQPSEDEIQPPAQQTSIPSSSSSVTDLLAGLQSQTDDDEEEIPDWLSSLTGDTGAAKKSVENRRMELGPSKPAKEPEDEMPSWLASLSGPSADADNRGRKEQPPVDAVPAASPFGAFTDMEPPTRDEEAGADWLTGLQSDASISEDASGDDTGAFSNVDLPDWLKGDEPSAPAPAAAPDWLKSLDTQAAPGPSPAPSAAEPAMDTADWLKSLDAEEQTAPAPEAPTSTEFDMPDWLKGMGDASASAPTASAAPAIPEASAPSDFETPDWFKDAPEPTAPETPAAADMDVPDWLKGVGTQEATASAPADLDMPSWLKAPSEPAPTPRASSDDFNVDLPNWLKSAKVETDEPARARPYAAQEPADAPPAPSAPTAVPAFTDFSFDEAEASIIETPDWLSNLGKPPAPTPGTSSFPTPETSIPSPIPDEMEMGFPSQDPLTGGDLDALFTDMPDWLNSASMPASVADQLPPADETNAQISPASLPSWVQAMRPVDTSTGQGAAAGESMETRGPLAGLQGVLPSGPYMGASSKPKPLAFKLLADDEQQSQAALLEQIMAAEAHPEPMITPVGVNSQRILRIVIFVLLLAVVAGAIFTGTQLFPLPVGSPAETMAAFNVVDTILPPDAPVLVIFDYEPALAGEMEAVAAPLLDHMIVKQHPRMALLSTSPTGAVMAERLFSDSMRDLPAVQYVNLGYLPGGLSAVRAFAQDPIHTLTLPADVSVFNLNPASVWTSPTLQGVQSFSNFAAIILITDSADAGRTWIEQAGPLRGSAQFVVISSAQAGPLLQPYYASGQINGLASGLYDAAVLEQNNAGRPGYARRYWDAYSLGLVLILVLLVGGALWSLAANLRERIASKEAR
jgi:hypothetical protein